MEIFGDVLLTKAGEKPTQEVLKDKVVGIYFSAHWCPPCRGFTPELAKAYSAHLQAKNLEIVFVSSDRDEEAFKEYYAEMPWLALPFADRDRKAALSKKFKVQGIPTFVILDQDGALITADGREAVDSDPTGEDFPWKPAPLSELLDCEVQTKDGTVPMASLEGKVLGLYFSAHWCPPCRGYTPKLAEKYAEIQAAGLPFEIVFISSDRDEGAFKEYFADQPWLALPYAERKRKEQLSKCFGVQGIPTLVLLDKDRSVITTNGRGAVMGDLADFPFHPKPVKDLAQDCDDINEVPSVIVLAESAGSDAHAAAFTALEPLAAQYVAAAKASGEDAEFCFYVAKSPGGPAPRIRQLCSLPAVLTPHEHPLENQDPNARGWGCDGCGKSGQSAKERHRCTKGCDFDFCESCHAQASKPVAAAAPTVVLLDIPDNGGYYVPEGVEVSTDGIKQLLQDYKDKKLTRKQLGK